MSATPHHDPVLRLAILAALTGLACAIGLLLVVRHVQAATCQHWAASSVTAHTVIVDGKIGVVYDGPHVTAGCRP